MKKYFILAALILISCEKDELMTIVPYPQYEMIFEKPLVTIVDGQEYSFETNTTDEHYIVIIDKESVISKETFIPTIGINTKNVYTKGLPKKELQIVLNSPTQKQVTNIIIE